MVFTLDLIEELTPQFDCKRNFGKERFTFFVPIDIGDFVVMIWTRDATSEYAEWAQQPRYKERDYKYSVSIYENGSLLQKSDPRIILFSWAQKLSTSWSEETYCREEIDQMLRDLKRISHF